MVYFAVGVEKLDKNAGEQQVHIGCRAVGEMDYTSVADNVAADDPPNDRSSDANLDHLDHVQAGIVDGAGVAVAVAVAVPILVDVEVVVAVVGVVVAEVAGSAVGGECL